MAASQDALKPELRRDVACPFCGLVCDDLEIEVAATGADGPPRRLPHQPGAVRAPASHRGRRAGRRCALRQRRGHCAGRADLAPEPPAGFRRAWHGYRGDARRARSGRPAGRRGRSPGIARAVQRSDGAARYRHHDHDPQRGPQPGRSAVDRRARSLPCHAPLSRALLLRSPDLVRRGRHRAPADPPRPAVGFTAGAAQGGKLQPYPLRAGRTRADRRPSSCDFERAVARRRRGFRPGRAGRRLSHGELCRGFLDGGAAAARCGGSHRAEPGRDGPRSQCLAARRLPPPRRRGKSDRRQSGLPVADGLPAAHRLRHRCAAP